MEGSCVTRRLWLAIPVRLPIPPAVPGAVPGVGSVPEASGPVPLDAAVAGIAPAAAVPSLVDAATGATDLPDRPVLPEPLRSVLPAPAQNDPPAPAWAVPSDAP